MQSLLNDFTLTPDPRWLLEVEGFDPATEQASEGACAIANGYLGVRAALDEGSAVSRPATLIAGVFNTPAQAPELEAPVPELVVAPDWSRLRIVAAGTELRLDWVELLEQRRVLDMRQGVLLREWRVRDAAGRITRLQSLRFVSLADRHALVQVFRLTPENYGGRIILESSVDGRVTNENNTHHLQVTSAPTFAGGGALALRTLQSEYDMAFAAHTTLYDPDGAAIDGIVLREAGVVGQRWEWHAAAGQTWELHKLATVFTSRESPAPLDAAVAHLAALVDAGIAPLFRDHVHAWAERWSTGDVEITGHAATQQQVRFALYHLIGAANPDDERASVGARALTGERYRGHVFWDTEIFVWPYYLWTHPPAARALLMYRYHTLDGARAKARAMGYRGALFSWEATDSGAETTPDYMLSGGERVPVLTGREEHHIAADIAYAIWSCRLVSGDARFFQHYGAEMLLEIAHFWASRATRGADQHYHIRRVIGPDEYHESVDDNAYTNELARWTLRRGLAVVAELQRDHPDRWRELAAQIELTAAELDLWRQVADGLVSNFDPQTNLIEQFSGYHSLEEIDLRNHDSSVATIDARLGWYEMQKTKVLKQADVVMLLVLLWDDFAPDVRAANFRYYEPKTSHDSSLSPSFHALVAVRLGDLTLAEDYLQRALQIDLDVTRKGLAGAAGGVHIAALGGVWQALAFGFLGMRAQDAGLRFDPHIPAHWGTLQLPIQWRGRQLRVTASAEPARIAVRVVAGEPLWVAIGDGPWQTVARGEPLFSNL
jgi:kojibiose phosphorylase